MTTYRLTPTEPDGDITGYLFTDEPALWDYVTETLAYEYGMDATDIIGTTVYGYRANRTGGIDTGTVIATVVRQ